MKKLIGFLMFAILSLNAFGSGNVIVYGKQIKNKDDLHAVLAKGLNFPAFYGKNLDALYDALANDTSGESVIRVKNLNILRQKIGNAYTDAFLETIGEASETNPRVILVLE